MRLIMPGKKKPTWPPPERDLPPLDVLEALSKPGAEPGPHASKGRGKRDAIGKRLDEVFLGRGHE